MQAENSTLQKLSSSPQRKQTILACHRVILPTLTLNLSGVCFLDSICEEKKSLKEDDFDVSLAGWKMNNTFTFK